MAIEVDVHAAPVVEKTKKDRERKKEKKRALQDTSEDGAMTEDKSKKKKRKADAEANGDVPVTAPEVVDGEKPKKKKKKDTDTSEQVPTDPSSSEPTKKKKRKSDVFETSSTPVAEDAPTKTKKSKKFRTQEVSAETEPSTSTSTSDAEAKASKKDKKKKSKSTLVEDSVVESSSPTSDPSSSTPGPSSAEVEAYLSTNRITLSLPDGTPTLIPALSFSHVSLPSSLRPILSKFKKPTPIQACAWPPALAGRDVVGIAETGSGKTLAFGLPALASLLTRSHSDSESKKSKKSKGKAASGTGIQILVLAPTRELAIQTHDTLSEACASLPLSPPISSVAVFGGVDKSGQIRALRAPGASIVVGTPGRIQDLVQDGSLDLSGVRFLVLDEADRMLDKGFENDIRRIIECTIQGDGRQTLMFSATWPESVRRLAASFQRDPVRITVGNEDLTANARITRVLEVFDDPFSKDKRLLDHLRRLKHPKTPSPSAAENQRMIVFVLYKNEAPRVEATLRRAGYSVMGLQGDMSQAGRMQALASFKAGEVNTLVATDVAARGLDIPDVAVVFNYTFPLTIEDYVHRIGRTGRGGKTGTSITFFTGEKHEKALAGELARLLQDGGFEDQCKELKEKFPMTIKKKTHAVYGAFFRDDVDMTKKPTKIKF